ncbi:DUF4190 domain-containing protein [Ruminococcus flavefaciens]|uniref:Uncharacterized protein DUF4190 n=1 Tax=Ruminococcus flavefaciens TaxID=1265 RepID=A0A315Y111_RUMFL|nr:DUF4190 domain-containing protein [Ruminococcus flavefaciens]PWJ13530.1 uncharacterized protein DUF4190 [Ruminococcus flavefaciens]SSA48043.1 protein of unknown function [Ruminococcus flavefaciens]
MDNNYNNGQQGGNQNLPEPTEEITGYIDGPDPNAPQGGYPNNSAPYGQQQNSYQSSGATYGQQQGGYQNGSAPYGQQQGYQNGPNPNYYGPQNPYQQQGYQNGPAPNYYGPQNPYQQNIQNPYQAPPEGSVGMAVASMVLGIVGFLISCCFYPVTIVMAVVGLILGAVAIKKGPAGKGMAVTGIVLSIISLAFAVLVIILAASAGTTSLWDAIEDMALFIK